MSFFADLMDDRMGFSKVQTPVEHQLSTQASINARDLHCILLNYRPKQAPGRQKGTLGTHALALTDEYD